MPHNIRKDTDCHPSAPAGILVLTHYDDEYRQPAMQAGADSLILESAMTNLLVNEILRVSVSDL